MRPGRVTGRLVGKLGKINAIDLELVILVVTVVVEDQLPRRAVFEAIVDQVDGKQLDVVQVLVLHDGLMFSTDAQLRLPYPEVVDCLDHDHLVSIIGHIEARASSAVAEGLGHTVADLFLADELVEQETVEVGDCDDGFVRLRVSCQPVALVVMDILKTFCRKPLTAPVAQNTPILVPRFIDRDF